MQLAKTKATKPAADGHSRAADRRGAVAGTPIPLPLAALIAPYRKGGDHLFRIERLPRGARLTAGRNNDDRTWTLKDWEIENVGYLSPAGAEQLPELSLRIIAMPVGETVAVLDFSVVAEKHGPLRAEIGKVQGLRSETVGARGALAKLFDTALAEAHDQTTMLLRAGNDELQRLRSETAAARSTLEKREVELAAAREEIDQTRLHSYASVESALQEADLKWKAAEAERYVAAELQWQKKLDFAVAQARTEAERQWQKNFETAIAKARVQTAAHFRDEHHELQRLRSETAAACSTLENREVELAAAREELNQLRLHSQASVESALQEAESKWKAAEAERHAAAELKWQERFTAAIAEVRALVETHLRTGHNEVQRLTSEVEAGRNALATCKIELAEAREELQLLHSNVQRSVESALKQAEANWKTCEAARTSEAETQWLQQTKKAVAAALSSAEMVRKERSQQEFERLFAELTATKVSLAERDAELAELHSALSRSQAESDKALAGARAETEAIRTDYNSSDIHLLRAKLSALETELAQARAGFREQRSRLEREISGALVEAEKQWKLDEIARMTQAKEQWQARTLKAVTEARSTVKPAQEGASDMELRRLRADYTAIKATLDARELELKRLKQAGGDPDEIILRPTRIRPASSAERGAERENSGRGFAVSVAVVAAVAASVVFLVSAPNADLRSTPQAQRSAADSPAISVPDAAPQTVEKLAILIHGGNVRAAPSGDADVMMALPRGTRVAVLERRGSWTRIKVKPDGNSADAREGWIFSAFLKDAGAT